MIIMFITYFGNQFLQNQNDKFLNVSGRQAAYCICRYFAPFAALTGSAFPIIIASGSGARSSSVVVNP
jgi:hypothetical protein